MGARVPLLHLAAATMVAFGGGPVSAAEADLHAPYEIVLEQQMSALLQVDWKGAGRDVDSGESIDVPEADTRRFSYVTVTFGAKDPMNWRSNLLRRLKTGRLTPGDLRVEPVEHANLVRAQIMREPHIADAFFKEGVGPDLSSDYYVAECFFPTDFEKGAIHCSTQLTVESLVVEISFDKAFLWDFDKLSAQAIAAAKDYLAKPSTQLSIERIWGPKGNR